MDRFMLKDVLDYPTPAEEAEIIRRIDSGVFTEEQKPRPPPHRWTPWSKSRNWSKRVYIDPAIVRYIVGLAFVTRNAAQYLEPGWRISSNSGPARAPALPSARQPAPSPCSTAATT